MKKKRDITIIALFLFLGFVFLVIYRNVFFKNEVIIPGDIPYNTPVWQGEAQKTEYYKADNYLLSDQINQFYVWHYIAHSAMSSSGVIPLWNPYIFAGQPLVANSQSALFYPPNLMLFFLDPGIVATLRAFFNLLILVIFGYLLGRQLGISSTGSVLISVGFALCGPVTVWLGHPHTNVFSWFPFLMWSGEKVFKGNRKMFWAGVFSVGVGFSILGGHPETAFHLLLIVSVYFLLRIIFSKKISSYSFKTSYFLIIAIILGILIGSIQLIPFTDFLFRSTTFNQGGRGEQGKHLLWSETSLGNLSGFATMIYPNFFGNPPDRTYNNPIKSSYNYNEQAIYFGLIPLSFLFLLLFRRKNPVKVKILFFISFFSLGIAWRLPFFEIFNHLPIFSMVANSRLKIFFVFTAIILAGFGFDRFKKGINSAINKQNEVCKTVFIPVLAILIFIVFSIIKIFIQLSGNSPFFRASEEVSFLNYLLFKIFSTGDIRTMITLIASIIFLLSVYMLAKGKLKIKGFEIIVLFMCIIDLAIPANGYNPTIKESDILPFPSVFSVFEKSDSPFRVVSDDNVKLQNYNAVHKIQLMGGYDLPVFKKYGDLFYSQNKGSVHNHNWNPDSELADFLSIKYFFTKGDSGPVSSKYKLIFDNLNFKVYENTNVFPRAFMVYDYKIISDKKKSLNYLKENNFKLRDKVVLNDPLISGIKKNTYSSDVKNSVDFIDYENDLVKLRVKTDKDGILVFSDIFMPGWRVYIDGEGSNVFLANYAFRGVVIPKGEHFVVFKYRPVSFTIGMILSILGFFSAAFFIVLGWRKNDL